MKKNEQLLGKIMILLAALAWGISYSVQRELSGKLGMFTIVFLKSIGVLALIPLLIIYKQRITKKTIVGGFIAGFLCFAGLSLQQKGIELSTAGKASFISALYLAIVPVICFFMGKKVTFYNWLGIVIALLGMYFLCIKEEIALSFGDVVLLIGALLFALQIIVIDKYVNEVDPIAFAFVEQMFISLFSSIPMIFMEIVDIGVIKDYLMPVLFITFISGAFANSCQIIFQQKVDASVASLLMSFESVFGALGGWLLLNETMGVREIIGCVLIFVSMIIVEKK